MARVIESETTSTIEKPLPALSTRAVLIDAHCSGDYWTAQGEEHLARLITLIAMVLATQAAHIIRELAPAAPAFTAAEIIADAKVRLTVGGKATARQHVAAGEKCRSDLRNSWQSSWISSHAC